jgi:hypothetical protein
LFLSLFFAGKDDRLPICLFQAANSADFSIAQFQFLSRLLFVHGAWNYSRISKVGLVSYLCFKKQSLEKF